MRILALNVGSSSVKFALFDMTDETLLLSGSITGIGETEGTAILHHHDHEGQSLDEHIWAPFSDHAAALKRISSTLSTHISQRQSLTAIGHRVVHGGESFESATLIDTDVIKQIRETIPLAPLHNPFSLIGIDVLTKLYPKLPQAAVFDTAFFHTLPPHAFHYAVPQQWYHNYHVRRYGFHGTSHRHVVNAAAEHLQQPLTQLRLISLHLGNGASAAATRNGICIDTSMGMTPLEGLVMGTRCGDIDPALPFYMTRTGDFEANEIEHTLNENSGIKGFCGVQDMRDVHRLAATGNEQAALAIDIYCYRICKYIGAYHVALGGVDALIFTAGVGENDSSIRQQVCAKLAALGIEIDAKKNNGKAKGVFEISTETSAVKVLVVPTNEELEIARQTKQLIQ